MSEILFQYYQVNPTTWMYLSSLLSIALFFKFNRVWSVRNLDLVGLVLLAPGLLAVVYGSEQGGPAVLQAGYIWLFSISAVFLVRMLADSLMVRRPLLEPNLSTGGLVFLGISLLVFLLANVIVSSPQQADLAAAAATSNRPQAREEASTKGFAASIATASAAVHDRGRSAVTTRPFSVAVAAADQGSCSWA